VSFIPVFSASLLQSSVSHDPSEITLIWWIARETFAHSHPKASSNWQFLPCFNIRHPLVSVRWRG